MSYKIRRRHYAEIFGPTTGDRVRLGDTSLHLEVERDFTVYGDECKFGGGKTIREGQGQAAGVGQEAVLDCVITNALIVDYTGIYKADIGIKNGLIAGIGKAGNPDVMAGVSKTMIIGVTTEVIAGEGLIVTAGGLDTHIHFICPQQAHEAIAAGLTTMIGGGTGPATGTCATTCTPGAHHLRAMLQATDGLPLNFGFTGKGNTALPAGLPEQIRGGAVGLKLHEDWGTTPASIDCCLRVADEYDVQVTIHTDTLNESGFLEATVKAIGGRTIHTYHSEGAGGGHAPDIIRICGEANVLPSSTNPTRPFTVNTIDEHLDMLMVCHHLDPGLPEDVAFAESRIRGETIAAEDILHDLGAISIMSSDSQAMGRIGEVITRTWQTADKMKSQRGPLPGDRSGSDNFRIKRFISRYTINPAIAHGVGHCVGSVEVGKLADLVLWRPAFFGVKPEMVVKGGLIAWSQMGDPNASIPTPQPVFMRPMFGAFGSAPGAISLAFVSKVCHQEGVAARYGLSKRIEPVRDCRKLGEKRHEMERCLAAHNRRSRNIRSDCGRRDPGLRAGRETAVGTTILSVLIHQAEKNNWLIWQLADSAFPSGGFAHSGGMEAAWQHGEIRDSNQLISFLESSLWQTVCGTIPLLRAAHEAPERIDEWNSRCNVFLSNHVSNRASRLQGRAFVNSAIRIFGPVVTVGTGFEAVHFAPIFGVIVGSLGLSASITSELFLFQTLRGLVAAAVRLGIAGPMEAQAAQHRLAPRAREMLVLAADLAADDIANTGPLLDIWQGNQDRLYSRLFQS